MTRPTTTARELLWRAIAQCAGARWHSLDTLPVPRRNRRAASAEPLHELVRLIQQQARQRPGPGGAATAEDSPAPLRDGRGAGPPGPMALSVALAFQHRQLAEQRLLLGEPDAAQQHCRQFVQGLMAAGVDVLGQGFSTEERTLIQATTLHLPGRLAAQIELRQALQRGALPSRWILILGMHRSGTSALSGMLSRAGYDAPADLMPADAVNPRGYWESKGLFHRNDALLEHLGSRWDQPERLPPGWEDSEAAITWRQGVLRHLETVFAGARAPLIKDPRLCLLLPGWLPWLESGWLRVEMLLTLRHPLEVASSLEKAQNLPSQEGLRLWLQHVLAAERVSRGWPRLLLRFEELIGDPDGSLDRCLQLLARPSEGALLNRDAGDFVLPQLHRQRRQELQGEFRERLRGIATLRDLALAVDQWLTQEDLNAPATAGRLDAMEARWQLLSEGSQALAAGS